MPSKKPVTDPTRLKAQQLREAQQRTDRRIRLTIIGVVTVVVLAIIAAVTIAIVRGGNDDQSGSQSGDAAAVLGPFADGSPVLLSNLGLGQTDDSLPTLTEYFDYTCHVCADVDAAVGERLGEQAEKGAFNIAYQPVTTVGMAYQKPATTASLIVAQKDPEHWVDFHHALLAYFEEQFNAGNGTVIQDLDKSTDQVAQIATEAGVPAGVVSTFTQNSVDAYLTTTTNEWTAKTFDGRDPSSFGTPEFVKDGTTVIKLSGTSADAIFETIMTGMGVTAK